MSAMGGWEYVLCPRIERKEETCAARVLMGFPYKVAAQRHRSVFLLPNATSHQRAVVRDGHERGATGRATVAAGDRTRRQRSRGSGAGRLVGQHARGLREQRGRDRDAMAHSSPDNSAIRFRFVFNSAHAS